MIPIPQEIGLQESVAVPPLDSNVRPGTINSHVKLYLVGLWAAYGGGSQQTATVVRIVKAHAVHLLDMDNTTIQMERHVILM